MCVLTAYGDLAMQLHAPLNALFRKSAKIGDPYAMRRLYALRRQCSFICARIVGQQTATAPANFKNNPHRPFDRPVLHNRRA